MMPPAVEVRTPPLPLTSAGADDLLDALRGEPGIVKAWTSGDPGSIAVHVAFRSLWPFPPSTEIRDRWEQDVRGRAAKLVSGAFGRLGLLVTVREVSSPVVTLTDFDAALRALDDFERAMLGHDHGSSLTPDALHVLRTWVDTAEQAEDPTSYDMRLRDRREADEDGD